MVDQLRNETTDHVTWIEAQERAAQIAPDSVQYSYTLALRMGDTFLGEAQIKFRAVSA